MTSAHTNNPRETDTMPAPILLHDSLTFPRLYVPPVDEESQAAVEFSECATIPMTDGLFAPPPGGVTVAGSSLFVPRYLVLLAGLNEDVPVGIFEHANEAVEFARDVRDNPDLHAGRYYAAIERPNPSLLQHSWLNVTVIEFDGPVPVRRTELFDLN